MSGSLIVKVEITYDNGDVRRVTGAEARRWQEAVDGQAGLCVAHGVKFPELAWEESKAGSSDAIK